jgi:hypothetical protein
MLIPAMPLVCHQNEPHLQLLAQLLRYLPCLGLLLRDHHILIRDEVGFLGWELLERMLASPRIKRDEDLHKRRRVWQM